MSAAKSTAGRIVRAAIHPAIGVARVGNSLEEGERGWFRGPEVTDPLPPAPGFYKDHKGALKRQAARFRVYGYDREGNVVAELTPDIAEVEWTVHLANKKSAWYQFKLALDIPEAARPDVEPSVLRNKEITQGRERLVIDPGPRTITGPNQQGQRYSFGDGECMGKQVYLGELRTDEQGRLDVLGGRGLAASFNGKPLETYDNNPGWFDDTSDGPVTARVVVDGQVLPVDPAWVVVAPPNYAPDVKGVRTLYDLLYDLFVTTGQLPFPATVSFAEHIEPILRRMCGLQWVNHGYATHFGHGGAGNFEDPAFMARLASTSDQYKELRRQVYTSLRDIERDGTSPVPWPWVYGDSMSLPPISPRQHLQLSPTQIRLMELWSEGRFRSDHQRNPSVPHTLDEVDLQDRPAMLDRAALDFCLADAFHPGCEVTWPIRHASMFMAPFRIRHRDPDQPEPNYGTQLTPRTALSVDGPLYAQGPGGLTRWMAVPWHADTASCRSGYQLGYGPTYDPYLPTFWPARVPNHVLANEEYEIAIDSGVDRAERLAAFEKRRVWYRGLRGDYKQQINQMLADWSRLGVVETRQGAFDTRELPATMLVESVPAVDLEGVSATANLITMHVPRAEDPAVAQDAVAEAVALSGYEPEEVTADFIPKVAAFRRAR